MVKTKTQKKAHKQNPTLLLVSRLKSQPCGNLSSGMAHFLSALIAIVWMLRDDVVLLLLPPPPPPLLTEHVRVPKAFNLKLWPVNGE